jgi:hypothetical protein
MLLKRPILAVVETGGVLGLLAGVVLGLLGGVLMVRGLVLLLRPKVGFSVFILGTVLARNLLFSFVGILLVFLATFAIPLLPRARASGFNTTVF